jgi:hypothetical protein
MVKKVWVRTLADRRGIRLLSVNNDTRQDTRLPVLTEVDGSMVPLEELDEST